MLGNAVSNKTRIYEVNGKPITKHKGFFIFKFEAYNCSIEYYRSPFLVPRGSPPRGSPKDVQCSLKVDNIDWTSRLWCGADVIVFNTGHWWNRQKTFKGNCYFQVGRNVNKSINVRQGFQMSMETWRRWVASNIDPLKTQVFFRTYAPVHFSDGTWKTGGSCDKEIQPYEEGTKFNTEFWTNAVVVEQVTKLTQVAHLLDITLLSAFRKDAHSSIYNVGPDQPRPFDHQDCSHWCLPGLPDTWNHILYTVLLRSSPWHS
ncbi:hypothetical protein KP509_35G011700 [Ceratopteris richardii]|nr:hypothetical protein KP509_35G011700 [Ceratopteris richardii]